MVGDLVNEPLLADGAILESKLRRCLVSRDDPLPKMSNLDRLLTNKHPTESTNCRVSAPKLQNIKQFKSKMELVHLPLNVFQEGSRSLPSVLFFEPSQLRTFNSKNMFVKSCLKYNGMMCVCV